MATQTLEFNAPSGLTISCKLFAVGSDTIVDTQTATEKTNAKNRYTVAFTDAPEDAYQLIGFVGSVGGFVNEIYDLLEETATFYPRSEQSTLSYVQTVGAVTASLGTYDPPTKAELDTAQASIQSVCATATGFSTHSAADVVTALGTGSTLTALASQASVDVVDGIVDDVKTVTVKLDTALELDGAVYRYTTNALEQGPSGSGLDAAGVRAAVGLASANLDTQLGNIVEDTSTTLPAQIAGISSTVTVTDISAAALAKFVTTDTTETTAADGSVAKIAQGGAVDNSAQLTRIEEQTSLITAAKVNIIGAAIVGNAGDIYQGSDYKVANGTAYEVSFSDPGAALKTILQDDAQTASILFGSGLKNEDSVNDLVGTIDPDNITASANVTTIKVEFTQAATAAADRGLHEFHIKSVTTSSEFESVRIVGEFTLRRERADVVAT